MTTEHVDELIDLYALGALEPGEQALVDEHLDECARCRMLLDEAKQIVLLMAWTPDQHDPPPDLQHKVMRRVQQLQRVEGRIPQSWWQNFVQRWLHTPRWTLQAATALALIAALVLGGRTWQLQRQVSALQAQAGELQPVAELLREPGTRLVALNDPQDASRVLGYLLLRPSDREAFLTTAALAPLPSDRTYQLWLINGNTPESAGTFAPDAHGVARISVEAPRPLDQYQVVGISVEPAGGSDQPTTTPIVLKDLDL